MRRKPYSVILFDEIEKAHHDVFNVLLQVLDDGRLTDGQGRTVDFKNTIVIMTSNLGSPIIQEYFDTGRRRREESLTSGAKSSQRLVTSSPTKEMEQAVLAELKKHFRPEFLNRVDDVIIFQSLDESELARIVDIQLGRLEQRLAQQNLTLDVDAAAKKLLASEGYDPQFGARPLKRAIQTLIENPLAKEVLAGRYAPRGTVRARAEGGRVVFDKV